MRIISGSARGKHLQTFESGTIRPTSDRVREALFSIVTSKIGPLEGLKVLDICAGTGALGIEALSRGATEAVFVDNSPQATAIIARNCRDCRLESGTIILKDTYLRALPRLSGRQFDLIFIDPPYAVNLLPKIIEAVSKLNLLAPGGLICAEESSCIEIASGIGAYTCIDTRNYGDTAIYLFNSDATPEENIEGEKKHD
ncbi:MAG: 16S rRNA (guanine(966)-N(2))-methyltransferase RsmD [Desulfuromonadaceae bacterium]|jgi:16S rRNA (guanine(966)-N(2))-methyltransferase RsmD|nr:16S rRNA (guanine(966)-N(2))-methyltransferase RsmD [Desulfuromonas sp.]MDY0184771.1 16S rRNA (guanine(966)-N(2))-methyltransferase RsmD [Desulfuromonadaceae bacterium]